MCLALCCTAAPSVALNLKICYLHEQLQGACTAPVTSSLEQLMPSVLNRNRLLFCGHVWDLPAAQQQGTMQENALIAGPPPLLKCTEVLTHHSCDVGSLTLSNTSIMTIDSTEQCRRARH